MIETLKQLGPARLAVMGGVVIGLLLFFIFLSIQVSAPRMELLYSDLDPLDSSAIAVELENSDIKYEITNDGARVMVPSDDVGRARMLLASEGLPNGGSMGYEIFDEKTNFGTTSFVQNVNQLRALEGELSRTITSLEPIKKSRVHLVLPKKELFSRDSTTASASVFINRFANQRIDNQQVLAIQQLVASAVPELKPENVSVVDQDGNLLARGGENEDALTTGKSEDVRRSYEQRLTQSIEDIVGRVVGYTSVRANVTADLNFDRIETNEQIYDPAGQVLRSSQLIEENNLERQGTSGGEVSIQNNLPGAAGLIGAGGEKPSAENNRVEEVSNYEISKTVRNMIREVGEVKKLSIAVLVDGTYKIVEDEEGKESEEYVPRTQQQLDQIASLVKSAVGFDETRGDTIEVINMQFAKVDTGKTSLADELLFGFQRSSLLDAIEVLMVTIMIILVILLVVQPLLGRLLSSDGPQLDETMEADLLSGQGLNPALAAPMAASQIEPEEESEEDEEEESMIDMQRVKGKVRKSSIKKVEDIVENYPNETVSVIRSWMNSEG